MTFSKFSLVVTASATALLFSSCANIPSDNSVSISPGSTLGKTLGKLPTVKARNQQIADESLGNYFVGRRYFVDRTSFWGYVRRPGHPWSSADLVIINEDSKLTPDRLHANGPEGARAGYDQNYEYKLFGSYTGKKVYEPNSNQFLPEFKLTSYRLINKQPGWLFTPNDKYHPKHITLLNPSRYR